MNFKVKKEHKDYHEIFYKATGLNHLNDKVIEASYNIWNLISKGFIKEEKPVIPSDIKVALGDLFSDEEREAIMLLSNLSKGLNRYGFKETFSNRDLAKTLEITPTIAKKWIDEADNLGLIEIILDDDGSIKYRFNKKAFLDLIEWIDSSINLLKSRLSDDQYERLEMLVKVASVEEKTTYEENKSTMLGENVKYSVDDLVDEIEELVNELVESRGVNKSLNFVEKVRSLRSDLGSEMVLKIIDCKRLDLVKANKKRDVNVEDIEECRKILEELKKRKN